MLPTFFGIPYIHVGQYSRGAYRDIFKQHPCLTASSASMPLVREHEAALHSPCQKSACTSLAGQAIDCHEGSTFKFTQQINMQPNANQANYRNAKPSFKGQHTLGQNPVSFWLPYHTKYRQIEEALNTECRYAGELPKQGCFGRAYRDIFTASHRRI